MAPAGTALGTTGLDYLTTRLHGATTLKTAICILAAVRTWNLTIGVGLRDEALKRDGYRCTWRWYWTASVFRCKDHWKTATNLSYHLSSEAIQIAPSRLTCNKTSHSLLLGCKQGHRARVRWCCMAMYVGTDSLFHNPSPNTARSLLHDLEPSSVLRSRATFPTPSGHQIVLLFHSAEGWTKLNVSAHPIKAAINLCNFLKPDFWSRRVEMKFAWFSIADVFNKNGVLL
jgi:hypothetical protein